MAATDQQSERNPVIQNFRYRLYPSKAQAARLVAAVRLCFCFWNQLMSERLVAHQAGRRLGLTLQLRQVAVVRRADACFASLHSHTMQLVAADVDSAWRAWQRRGSKGRLPSLRRECDVRSLGFKQAKNGFHLDGRRLRLFQIGRVAVRWHRELQGTLKTLRVSREAGRWFATFGCEVEPVPLPATDREVGIDMGTDSLLTLSTGERFTHPRWALAAKERLRTLRDRLQRTQEGTLAHQKAHVRLGRFCVRVAARRRDYLSKIVASLVATYDRIALENLNVARLAALRQSVSDAGWGLFRRLLVSKSQSLGRQVTFVNLAWTSQTCSACGCRNRRYQSLSEREFACEQCAYRADRDVNAARVVLRRAQEFWQPVACIG
jgi:putative transposase